MNEKLLLVLGAGVDKTEGINMPLANELVPQIRDFLHEDEIGKQIDKILRTIIKGLRFSYDDFVKKAVDKLATDFKKEVNSILVAVKETQESEDLSEENKKIAQIIIIFLEKIQKLQNDVALDDETADLIKSMFSEVDVVDENIINLGKLSFSDTFDIVMKKILEKSIAEPNHPVLKHVYKNLMDFENLLLKHFIGFYNDGVSDIKKYLYISWTLWAFLVWKEKQVFDNKDSVPFYGTIEADKTDIITFNYTSLSYRAVKDTKYFHGNLQKFIRLDNRQECNIDDYFNLNIEDFFNDTVKPNIDFENKKYIIPSIIPPIKLKPVLSNNYIDIWYKSVDLIKNADKIIIIGYSFNYADEHFNDLIRKNKDKKIYIIDISANNIMTNIQRIFSYRENDYTQTKIQSKNSYQKDNLTIIETKANKIDLEKL